MTQQLERRKQHEESVAEVLDYIRRIEDRANEVIRSLRSCTDEQLEEYMIAWIAVGRAGFRVRGAIAREIQRRIAKRLNGGRGHRDEEGVGVKAHLARVAAATGVDLRTIEQDAAIHETFFVRSPARSVTANILPREFYRIALQAPDPHRAIKVAESHVSDPSFTTDAFRAYVAELRKEDKPHDAATAEKFFLRAFISQQARRAMVKLCSLWSCEPNEVVDRALIETVKEEQTNGSKNPVD